MPSRAITRGHTWELADKLADMGGQRFPFPVGVCQALGGCPDTGTNVGGRASSENAFGCNNACTLFRINFGEKHMLLFVSLNRTECQVDSQP